ncbi:hypothetical protein JIP62_14005 [Brevundimonas vitis]|uniref:DUF6249 domain-containing protein n=1 Tax=Brevundimonas vitisensis TaxID=2800818 RepID=A0ABX7BLD8_9CAUL|nr:DUF6249 domain-containing protein [Brevundimonas vitisensis]QQQ18387.1 hypothetical protein JIP62_14005 [Brevundimonas vitisensis]
MDDLIPLFAIFAVFGTITAIIVGPTYLKSRERREIQQTVRAAIDKGQALPPEVIEAMSKDVTKNLPSRSRDLRKGIIWLAVGIGLAAFGVVSDMGGNGWNGGVDNGLLGIACIPATIGLAFIVLSFFNKNKD